MTISFLNKMLRRTLRFIIILVVILLFSTDAQAQLNADFTANKTQGCSPIVVQFNNQSSGSITDYKWRLGTGGTSDSVNPSVSYSQPGKYTVTLIVSNGSNKDSITKTNFITVFENPDVNFKASPKNGCKPLQVSFTDQSTKGDAPISSYSWDFGDGGTSTNASPQHTYLQAGKYKVSLVIKDQNGCSDVRSKNNYIDVDKKPKAQFTASPRSDCNAPLTVYFNNRSTGTSPLTYEWRFGNGAKANNKNPNERYQQSGRFDITLVVTDANGCKDSVTKKDYVVIQDFKAGMNINKTEGCINPFTDTFRFKDTSNLQSSSVYEREWSFGDGNSSSVKNPPKIYGKKGVYPVKLVAGSPGCKDTLRDTIRVQQVEADFYTDSTFSCHLPFKVLFSDSSTNDQKNKWWFGNGNTSTKNNPSNTYTAEDTFEVSMVATNDIGCKDSAFDTVITQQPNIRFITSPKWAGICQPDSFQFKVIQKYPYVFGEYDPVISNKWYYGDDSTEMGQKGSHNYLDTAKYEVTHIIETQSGCRDTAKNWVAVGDTPNFKFWYDTIPGTDTFCGGSKVSFNKKTDFADSVVYRYLGDRLEAPTTINDTTYEYDDTTGYFHPYAIPFHNGCQGDTVYLPDSIYIQPPIAKFNVGLNCDSPRKATFATKSIDADRWFWDFGDGDTSMRENPRKDFPDPGNYKVKLKVVNDSTKCLDSTKQRLNVNYPKAQFTMSDSVSCPPLNNVQFDAAPSANIKNDSYYWNFRNGNIYDQTKTRDTNKLRKPPLQDYKKPGEYDVQLVVNDKQLCRDTIVKTVNVYDHTAHIVADPPGGCLPLTVNFRDTTQSDTTITSREWTFDDGSGISTKEKPKHKFNKVRSYNVKLRTEDARGCRDTTNQIIRVGNPSIYFTAEDTEACRGEPIQFTPRTTPDSIQLIWDFGDGDTSSQQKPIHRFEQNGDFDVQLIGIDSSGCPDTAVRSQFVSINSPVADFALSDTNASCPPLGVDFYDSSKGKNMKYEWLFGDNSSSLLSDPFHQYTKPGTYPIRLTLEGKSGCTDTLRDTIRVRGPRAEYNIIPDSGCPPLKYEFYAYDKEGVESVIWDVGKGVTIPGDSVSHKYQRGGLFVPKMIINNNQGCEYAIRTTDTVLVDTIRPIIDPGKENYCSYEDVELKNRTKGTITDWAWTLESPFERDSTKNPDFEFDSLRQYNLKLVVTNYQGCKDSTANSFTIHPKPEVFASGGGFICEGQEIQLQAKEDADFNYQWLPLNGLDRPQSKNPLAGPDSTTQYRVYVDDENNCRDTSDKVKVLVQRRPRVQAFPDTTIIKGDSVELLSNVQTGVKGYQWSPDDSMQCNDCPSTYVRPFEETVYTLSVEDTSGCFEESDQATVKVEEKFKIVLPEAFTPNGDGNNDKIYVKGWGIKELLTFKIFNRWGEMVYESQKLNEGWDGYYQGELQNTGSYSYYVKAKSYLGEVAEKKGMFNLLH